MGKREERKRHSRRRASINKYGVSGTSGLSVLLELAVQEREKKKKIITEKGRDQIMEGLKTQIKITWPCYVGNPFRLQWDMEYKIKFLL